MNPHFATDSIPSGKILVVDDEPSILAITAAILNTIGVTPIKARTGEDAVAAVKAVMAAGEKVALVVQDLTMPGGMSGFETMEAIRSIDPEIRVIACSGFFQEGALDLCRSIGFTSILAKPYTPDSLLGIIRHTLHESPPPLPPKSSPAPEAVHSSADASFFAPAADDDSPGHSAPLSHAPDHEASLHSAPPVLVGAGAMPDDEAGASRKRGPSFLASAIAQSLRSRLQPQRTAPDTLNPAAPSSDSLE